MAEILKGVVVSIEEGGAVRALPCDIQGIVSPPITAGADGLSVGDVVAMAIFLDGTGIILGKM
jgi:hypothetical protein